MSQEHVLCAAIYVDDGIVRTHQPVVRGLVYGGWRHHTILQLVATAHGRVRDRTKEVQGFLTTTGRFVTRAQALQIALAAGQVTEDDLLCNRELYSEDLY